ncbi:MAG TPA: 6-phosphofructokinase [Candidatus Manganitrophaceae bacterium]|nr:6-phosphofructokinase [Candidatus Manganitrophaceae bacterium]
MKVGVLTGGGDCPGLNAVIRAIVKASKVKHNWEVIGVEEGFEGLMTPVKTRVMTPWTIRGILPTGGTILGTTSGMSPARMTAKGGGDEGKIDIPRMIKANVKELGLTGLIVIGGDGTLKIGLELYEIGVPVVGIPKTIDNDIPATDLTFGFQTAVNTATEALDKLHTTAESHHRIIVVEVMGRYAGWIALEAGIAGGADVILIPEIPFQIDQVCKKIASRYEQGSRFSIVVVAEGAKPVGGEMSILKRSEEGYVERLGGIGTKVGDEIARCVNMDVRVTVLGHLQRGGSPTPFDRILATRFGVAAVNLIAEGRFGAMVRLRGTQVESVPLAEATRALKLVPPDGELVKTAEGLGITFGR